MSDWLAHLSTARFIAYSVAIHAALFGVLFLGFSSAPEVRTAPERPEIVNAVALEEQSVMEPIEARREAAAAAERQAEEAARRAAEEEQRQEEAERQRRAEEEERRRQEEAERQRRAEEEERRRQEEAERQRQAEEEERRRQEREAELQRQAEQEALERRGERALSNLVGAWTREVESAWTRPPGTESGLSADIRVRLRRDGEVVNATIARSSGSSSFDRSARIAVQRASPLSVPDEDALFDHLGLDEVVFRFKPDGT